jgi:hypothetical protein
LLREDQFVLLGKTKIGHALAVGAKPRTIIFVGSQIFEGDRRERDVVGAFSPEDSRLIYVDASVTIEL